PKELDPDEDELTRSRKLRRKHLEQKYLQFIEAIYTGAHEFSAAVPIKYQDGRTGMLNATVNVNEVDSPNVGDTASSAPKATSLLTKGNHG
ncbi:MAG: hypothetical protein D4R79_16085, partial [Comamonadaceae bacterium]